MLTQKSADLKPSVAKSRLTDLSPRAILLNVYAATLALVALAITGIVLQSGFTLNSSGDWWGLGGLLVLALFVERETLRLTPSIELSVAFLPLTFVAVVWGPLAAAVLGGVSMIVTLPAALGRSRERTDVEQPFLRWLVWTANRVIDGALAGLAAYGVFQVVSDPAVAIALATAAATAVCFAVDLAVTALTLLIRGTGSARDVVREALPVAATGTVLYSSVVAVLAYAYLELTPLSAALFIIPAIAAQRLFAVTRRQRDALQKLEAANLQLERANLSFAAALVATLDARDRYTAGHSAAVADYARDICAEMGFDADGQQLAHLCGLVHDIGKIGLPPGLLEKPGALTPAERAIMEDHSAIGERILANVEDYAEIALIVRHHHERIDGLGYPDRLRGDEIPFLSRVIGVADAYDAMTSDRPYRQAMPSEVARERLRESAGSQFDPDVVTAFERVLARSDAPYRAGRRSRRAVLSRRDREPTAVAV
jgi:putative nucleotidyltransferase with HDIG domain